jgi:hypothetical protein
MRLDDGDKLASIARIPSEFAEETGAAAVPVEPVSDAQSSGPAPPEQG